MWESEKGIQAAVASFLCLCGEWLFDGRKKRGRPSRQKAAGHKKAAAAKNTWQPVVMGNDGTLLDMTFLACRLRKKRQARRGGALWQGQKKIPARKYRSGMPFFIHRNVRYAAVLAAVSFYAQAGLLTPDSSYWSRLPDQKQSVTWCDVRPRLQRRARLRFSRSSL